MAPDIFGRVASVTIGPPGETGRVFSGLRVQFNIHKTGDSAPNKAELTITGLSADSRKYAEHGGPYSGAPAYAVLINAGYQTDNRLIYSGKLELASSRHQTADWETKITSTDGGHEHRAIILSKSFGPKTSHDAIIHEVARAMGVTLGTIKGLSKGKVNHGRALTGSAAAEMDRLCRSHGVRWSIQNGVLHILPYGASVNPMAILLSPSTGLIGSPEKTERGIKAYSALRGEAEPGRVVQIQSSEINGNFVIEDVIHEGDTHGDHWRSTIEAIPLTG